MYLLILCHLKNYLGQLDKYFVFSHKVHYICCKDDRSSGYSNFNFILKGFLFENSPSMKKLLYRCALQFHPSQWVPPITVGSTHTDLRSKPMVTKNLDRNNEIHLSKDSFVRFSLKFVKKSFFNRQIYHQCFRRSTN